MDTIFFRHLDALRPVAQEEYTEEVKGVATTRRVHRRAGRKPIPLKINGGRFEP